MRRVVETVRIPVDVTVFADTDSDVSGKQLSDLCRIEAERYLSDKLPGCRAYADVETGSMPIETTHGKFAMSFRTEMVMSMETFVDVCNECGLRTKITHTGCVPGGVTATAYLDSDILRDKSSSLCEWSNEYNGPHSPVDVFAYDALWKNSNGLYTVNGEDLGDCPIHIRNIDQLKCICKNAISIIRHLESDKGYRPECATLNCPLREISNDSWEAVIDGRFFTERGLNPSEFSWSSEALPEKDGNYTCICEHGDGLRYELETQAFYAKITKDGMLRADGQWGFSCEHIPRGYGHSYRVIMWSKSTYKPFK